MSFQKAKEHNVLLVFCVTINRSESWSLKKQANKVYGNFWTLMLKKTPENTADSQENKLTDTFNKLSQMTYKGPESNYHSLDNLNHMLCMWWPSSLENAIRLGMMNEREERNNQLLDLKDHLQVVSVGLIRVDAAFMAHHHHHQSSIIIITNHHHPNTYLVLEHFDLLHARL